MKAILEFNLPEEECAFHGTIKGEIWRAVVQQLDDQMRTVIKHGDDPVEAEHAQKWRDRLNELVNDNDLAFYS